MGGGGKAREEKEPDLEDKGVEQAGLSPPVLTPPRSGKRPTLSPQQDVVGTQKEKFNKHRPGPQGLRGRLPSTHLQR